MKANELRLGNWVNIPSCGINATIDIIGNKRFCIDNTNIDLDTDDTSFDLEDASPIQLTEEWLLRFGFSEIGITANTEYYVLEVSENMDIEVELNPSRVLLSVGREINVVASELKMEYVHQLQNLYFVLTGKELQ